MKLQKVTIPAVVVLLMGALLLGQNNDPPPSGLAMTTAARAFLETLTPEQRERATFAYDSPERLNWHFIPRERRGIPLKDLDGEALAAARRLLTSGLSESGYDQTLNVMSLEEVLYLLEGGEREYRRRRRDPQNYYLTVFGTPGPTGTWGWRFEGHHLSLNYSVKDHQTVASTPEFFGANPAMIDAGPNREIRVLGPEEDIARQILKLCTPAQLERCLISSEAPDDVRGGGEPQAVVTAPVGLRYAEMSRDQKQLLIELLDEYLRNMPADVSRERRAALEAAGLENIHFAWWGEQERNKRHHYVVQGPTFIIEYNNTQNDANHIHAMWRNVAGDFNVPAERT